MTRITEEKATISFWDLHLMLCVLAEKAATYNGTTFEDFMEEGYFYTFLDYLQSEPPNEMVTLTATSFKKEDNL